MELRYSGASSQPLYTSVDFPRSLPRSSARPWRLCTPVRPAVPAAPPWFPPPPHPSLLAVACAGESPERSFGMDCLPTRTPPYLHVSFPAPMPQFSIKHRDVTKKVLEDQW